MTTWKEMLDKEQAIRWAALEGVIGKRISALTLVSDVLHFTFDEGTRIMLLDEGEGRHESRYMQTDDNLGDFVGAELWGVEVLDAGTVSARGEDHEVQFLVVTTSEGVFTMVTHNEHNGYYGGFCIVSILEEANGV